MGGMNGSAQIAQTALAISLLVLCLIIGIWDAMALYWQRTDLTVSNLLGSWGRMFPILPFLLGILAGHLFWPRGGN